MEPLRVSTMAFPNLPECTFTAEFPAAEADCPLKLWHPSTLLLMRILFPHRPFRFKVPFLFTLFA